MINICLLLSSIELLYHIHPSKKQCYDELPLPCATEGKRGLWLAFLVHLFRQRFLEGQWDSKGTLPLDPNPLHSGSSEARAKTTSNLTSMFLLLVGGCVHECAIPLHSIHSPSPCALNPNPQILGPRPQIPSPTRQIPNPTPGIPSATP